MNSVFAVNIENIIKYFEVVMPELDVLDRQAVLKYKFKKDQYRKFVSILLSRFLIRKMFSLTNYELVYNSYGKPYLKEYSDKNFNISHSGKWVVGVISNKPVGIDIEFMNRIDGFKDIAKSFFSQDEYKFLIRQTAEKQLQTFYEIWTKKESLIKAEGKGLSILLDSFTVPFKTSGKVNYEKNRWNICLLEFIDIEYKLAIASKFSYNKFSQVKYLATIELLDII